LFKETCTRGWLFFAAFMTSGTVICLFTAEKTSESDEDAPAAQQSTSLQQTSLFSENCRKVLAVISSSLLSC
jgi:hypothetical protein